MVPGPKVQRRHKMERTYKGFEIVKQYVGPCGWNIVRNGRCVKTGCRSLTAAREWINFQIDSEEAAKHGF